MRSHWTGNEFAHLPAAGPKEDWGAKVEFYVQIRPWLLRILRDRVPPSLDPEDICEQALVTGLLKLEELRAKPRMNFPAYVVKIALHIVERRARHRSFRTVPLDGFEGPAKDAGGRFEPNDVEEIREDLRRSLKPSELRLVEAIFFSGARASEISLDLGLSEAAWRKRWSRLRPKLRSILSPWNPNPPR
jgi:DNA-directed RNA polymerase specialized sigma24 family protein